MLLLEVIDLLSCQVIWGEELLRNMQVGTCFAADLMSEVLAYSEPGALLVTGLINIQSIHTADVADMRAILFVNGKRPGPEVIGIARDKGIPLLTTGLSMFAACGVLHANGLKSASRS